MTLSLDKNKKYLLACSFGPDSMALFDMLLKEKYNFDVAHVNYNLRPEAKKETEDLIKYCRDNNICIHIKYVKEKIEKNIEENCREIRYKFFKELVDQYNYDEVLIAHNEDDLLETYFLQKHRKNLVNFYGIKENSFQFGINITRPLLFFTKEELLNYCLKFHVPFAIDSSNEEDKFLRNKIRHSIVSKLSLEERIELRNEIDIKNYNLENLIDYLDSIDLNNVNILLSLKGEVFLRAVTILSRQIIPESEISYRCAKEIEKVLKSSKTNIVMKVNKNLNFIKTYDRCYFELLDQPTSDFHYVIEKPSKLDTPYFYLDFTNGAENRNVTENDYPLIIKNLRSDDEVLINDYKVKANRLMIDWKVPLNLRKRYPVILNKNGKIIYVPRYQNKFKIDSNTNFYIK